STRAQAAEAGTVAAAGARKRLQSGGLVPRTAQYLSPAGTRPEPERLRAPDRVSAARPPWIPRGSRPRRRRPTHPPAAPRIRQTQRRWGPATGRPIRLPQRIHHRSAGWRAHLPLSAAVWITYQSHHRRAGRAGVGEAKEETALRVQQPIREEKGAGPKRDPV